ncbi:MAG: hypothetical protein JRC93_11635 [Deltaproteobacteria bacterium]|nr:hypothetical protein [Deltaproteobacteria bacterium]
MDKQELLIATNIAVLRRQFPPIEIVNQILYGLKVARQVLSLEAIIEEAGDTPPFEVPVVEINGITATTSYATIVEKTITAGRTGKISKMEMACRIDVDYDIVHWRLTINSRVVFEDKLLPSSLTLDLADITIGGGKLLKIEAKTTAGTSLVWGDITGKEVF